jgi:hypothetical protein
MALHSGRRCLNLTNLQSPVHALGRPWEAHGRDGRRASGMPMHTGLTMLLYCLRCWMPPAARWVPPCRPALTPVDLHRNLAGASRCLAPKLDCGGLIRCEQRKMACAASANCDFFAPWTGHAQHRPTWISDSHRTVAAPVSLPAILPTTHTCLCTANPPDHPNPQKTSPNLKPHIKALSKPCRSTGW